MRKLNILFTLLLILITSSLLSCVQAYQRSLRAVYIGSNSSRVFSVLNGIVKERGFSSPKIREQAEGYAIIAEYHRYNVTLRKTVMLSVYLKDSNEEMQSAEMLITVGAGGWEQDTKSMIDEEFEILFTRIESRYEGARFKILNKS